MKSSQKMGVVQTSVIGCWHACSWYKTLRLGCLQEHASMNTSHLFWLPSTGFLSILEFILRFYCLLLNRLMGWPLCTSPTSYRCTPPQGLWGQLRLVVPKTKTRGDRAFSAVAPRLWNDLPPHVKLSPTLQTVKSRLKTHLFSLTFESVWAMFYRCLCFYCLSIAFMCLLSIIVILYFIIMLCLLWSTSANPLFLICGI